MRTELNTALVAAKELPTDELPRLLGDLEGIRATPIARLNSPAVPTPEDELLDDEEGVRRLAMRKEQRGQRPTMRDLKGSSALEQDASVILLAYLPLDDGLETGEDELILAKNREGEPGVVRVRFRGALMRFLKRDVMQ